MIKIFKYLKNSIFSILLIIALLFIQANLDLTLPEYTSKIVNIGVQQGGIEDAAIKNIGADSLNKLFLFMTDDDKNYILSSYEKDYEYNNEVIYKLKSNADTDKINDIFVKPMSILVFLEQYNDYSNDINTEIINNIPSSILQQTAITYVKKEYKRINVNTDKIQNKYLIRIGAIMLLISLAVMLVDIFVIFIGSRMAAKLAKVLRENVFKKVVYFSKNEVKKFGQSSLITRTTNDIQQVQMVIIFLLRVVFYAPIIGIGGIIKALNTNSSMTYIIGMALSVILVVMVVLFSIATPKFNKIQKMVDRLNLVSRQILSGLPVIRAFSNEKYEEDRFDEANKNLTRINLFINRTMSFMMPLMILIMNLVAVLIVYKGAYGVDNGTMQVGDIMAYIQYTMQIIMAFLMISIMSIMLPRANVSAKRIIEVIEEDISVKDPMSKKSYISDEKGLIEFKKVSFRYPDADYDVITDIDFTAKSGETTAIIGSTGSGKSTIVNLLLRFYDVTDGVITVDGVNIKDISLTELRNKIGYVSQKGILFTGSIKENIKFGNKNIKKKDIDESLKIAQAEFVNKLGKGIDYQISQGGSNVSGGQKQRLSIARAIAKNPNIYIFDDCFSALDFKTDHALRRELTKVVKNKTVLVIAQRISTIMNADKIIVLDNGNIVGIGDHQELLKNCKVYQEIALSQLSKEELENA